MFARVHARRLNRCTRGLCLDSTPPQPDLDPSSACLSADWAGTLVLLNSSLLGSCFFWSAFSMVVWLASSLWGTLFPFFVLFWVVCLGLCFSAFHLLLPALVVPLSRVSFGLCAFLDVLLSGAAGFFSLVAAVLCFLLGCFARFCSWFLGLLRFGPLSPGFAPSLPTPLGWSSGAFWSSQCSAGPSLRVSGCICNGPVVIPLVCRVVTDWLLSSLLLMATKASALCGALPSTPCCGCCLGAPRSCTEVFALG